MKFIENYPLLLIIALMLWVVWHHLGFWAFFISIVILIVVFIICLLVFAIAMGLAMEHKYKDYERRALNKLEDERNE